MMGHSAELIRSIQAQIESDYPRSQYDYEHECGIPLDRKMRPDILVYSRSKTNGPNSRQKQLVCVVEIGYTRPEKLSAYKKLHKIPDVRWYDKKGILHAELEKQIIVVKREAEAPPPNWVRVFQVERLIPCPHCFEWESADKDEDEDYFLSDEYLEDEEELVSEVVTNVITNFNRALSICHCDCCGHVWSSDPENDLECQDLVEELEKYDFQSWRGPLGRCLHHGDWEVADSVFAYHLKVVLQDGIRLRDAAAIY